MSAASRSLRQLARHYTALADKAYEQRLTNPIYNAEEMWDQAAVMAHAAADEERWRERIVRWVRRLQ